MIINSTEIDNDGVSFNRLTHTGEYYYCAHNGINVLVKTKTPTNGKTDTQLQLFGADTLENLQSEITNLGLVDLPTPPEDNINLP